jgi:DNA-binding NarL/FixJ family response regulator
VVLWQNTERRIRVLVADAAPLSSQLLVEGLGRTSAIEAASTSSADETLDALTRSNVDILLISPNFSGNHGTGAHLVRKARLQNPELNVIFMIDVPERHDIVEAFRAGARGIIARSNSFEALCKCIVRVHEGQVWADAEQLNYLLEALTEPAPMESDEMPSARPLSRREEEIARLVAAGYSNRQISEQLKLSEHTIKNYLFRVFEKLGVSTRVELTLYALKHGNIPRTRNQAAY